ncbi:hypothetical protein IQ266_21120 [filamentous cyanobacterium LEGE 11480]|uniref:Uncharacterized protein n=1 Tax=Romeriopsis navalis LEGE 11480 TaxID=2777977 RepID=A0A928VSL2_9CYAN|nr:hypothetical protein [Romeriopsis navalis]MBE9032246.1 hypothetical protein [Romeriopsis navalis LEGE 11480]
MILQDQSLALYCQKRGWAEDVASIGLLICHADGSDRLCYDRDILLQAEALN